MALPAPIIAAAIREYEKTAPRLAAWMEENLPQRLAALDLPEPLRKRLRTSNACERLNKQIGRRTAVCAPFPNEASLLRLATAIMIKQSEEWETGKAYLNVDALNTNITPQPETEPTPHTSS